MRTTRVIIVDDENASLELAKDACEECLPDAECAAFNNPKDALAHAKTAPPDIALLDIHMYQMSGLDLAHDLKEINPKVNVIFVTGHSEHAVDAVVLHASDYITKPVTNRKLAAALDNLLFPIVDEPPECRAQAFGNFEFFVNGRPVRFSRRKAKELLAVLVDRKGASITTEQMAAYLFENRNYNRNVKDMLMPVIRSLREGLAAVGAEDVLVKSWGHLSVDTSRFTCDAYEFEKGDEQAMRAFHGEYMAQYSWAEDRVGVYMW